MAMTISAYLWSHDSSVLFDPLHYPCRVSCHHTPIGHILRHNRAGAYSDPIPDGDTRYNDDT